MLAASIGIIYHRRYAGVAERVDAADLKSAEALLHTGSIPVPGIFMEMAALCIDQGRLMMR